jgi:hypothetical protein
MSDNPLPDFIHAGTTKAASSWLYNALSEHPEVSMAKVSDLNFFNVSYHRQQEWYAKKFDDQNDEKVVGEVSPGYLQHPWTAERIAETVPDAKILFCLRNPVDRAYSHWWHSYSNKYVTYEFEEIFEKYAPYHHWVMPGFYDHHLSRFYEEFPEDQIEVFLFDDLVEDDEEFLREYFSAIGVDSDFRPSVLDTKENTADATGNYTYVRVRNWIRENAPSKVKNTLKIFWDPVRGVVESADEYNEGMDEDIQRQLERVYQGDITNLSSRIGRDLSHWLHKMGKY